MAESIRHAAARSGVLSTKPVCVSPSPPITAPSANSRREVSNLLNKYKPQVLIIDVPGDIDDDYNYLTQKAVKGDYNIVLVEPFSCSDNYFSMLEKEIRELYCGKVHNIVVSECAMNFIEDDCECGFPIKEKSLKRLCNSKLTVYDIESIYSQIKDYFSNPKIL